MRSCCRLTAFLALACAIAPSGAFAAVRGVQLKTGLVTQSTITPHLTYYGGPVLSNVKVYAVLWGGSVSPNVASALPGFYQAVMASPYLDWLNEYNTTSAGGTSQLIGRGAFAGVRLITPSTTSTFVTDYQIQQELIGQMANQMLPLPDANTLFMVYFPPGITISSSSGTSCVQFCAYHSAVTTAYGVLYYGVVPDMGPTTGCSTGCGPPGDEVSDVTMASSHEMVEAITDGQVSLDTSNALAAPLAWYDQTNSGLGEIGDICNGMEDFITDSAGTIHAVQQEWSNTAGACVSSRTAANDFALSIQPLPQPLAAGQTVTVPVELTLTNGAGFSANLSVVSTPPGVTATLGNATLPVPSGTLLTVTVDPAASFVDQGEIVIRADGPVTHTAVALADVITQDFVLTEGSPGPFYVVAGSKANIPVASAVGFGGPASIWLSAAGAGSGFTYALDKRSITAGQTATLSVTAPTTLPVNPTAITAMVTGQAIEESHQLSLSIQPLAEPTVSLDPGIASKSFSGTAKLTGTAQLGTNSPEASVTATVDGSAVQVQGTEHFAVKVDTTKLSNGSHTLSVTAQDGPGSAVTGMSFEVQNGCSIGGTSLGAILLALLVLARRPRPALVRRRQA